MTRGTAREFDYRWFPEPPTKRWWLADRYAERTQYEHGTAIMESDEHGWRLYMGGIPSGRRDTHGTLIRWTVVASDSGPGGEPGAEDWVEVLSGWLRSDGRIRLGRCLDEHFTKDEIDFWYSDRPPAELPEDLVGALAVAAKGGLDPQAVVSPGSASRCQEFVALARELTKGRRGVVAFLNAADMHSGGAGGTLEREVWPEERVFLMGPGWRWVKRKKADGSTAANQQGSRLSIRGPTLLTLFVVAIAVFAVIALIGVAVKLVP